ncbi:3356_t:CDS:10 [Scutellospora calospora]|uniref:3356_t:CDS:1 n=1 Tax=Scutellospora calospora TaxID=85575 RepID=A0ACA9KSQ3_9GLOM|nr:3356_t:CDS:10 [Scutellospora calospora]
MWANWVVRTYGRLQRPARGRESVGQDGRLAWMPRSESSWASWTLTCFGVGREVCVVDLGWKLACERREDGSYIKSYKASQQCNQSWASARLPDAHASSSPSSQQHPSSRPPHVSPASAKPVPHPTPTRPKRNSGPGQCDGQAQQHREHGGREADDALQPGRRGARRRRRGWLTLLHGQHRHWLLGKRVLAVAREPRPRRPERSRAGANLRRSSSRRVQSDRNPLRPAPPNRPLDRTPLGTHRQHIRRRRRADLADGRRVHQGFPRRQRWRTARTATSPTARTRLRRGRLLLQPADRDRAPARRARLRRHRARRSCAGRRRRPVRRRAANRADRRARRDRAHRRVAPRPLRAPAAQGEVRPGLVRGAICGCRGRQAHRRKPVLCFNATLLTSRGLEVVETVGEADLALVRLQAPYEPRPGGFEANYHAGSLEYNATEKARQAEIFAAVPTIVDIYLDRPAAIPEIAENAAALLGQYGASPDAFLDVVFGIDGAAPQGKLPFDLPRSMAAVEASMEDVPFDTEDPEGGRRKTEDSSEVKCDSSGSFHPSQTISRSRDEGDEHGTSRR